MSVSIKRIDRKKTVNSNINGSRIIINNFGPVKNIDIKFKKLTIFISDISFDKVMLMRLIYTIIQYVDRMRVCNVDSVIVINDSFKKNLDYEIIKLIKNNTYTNRINLDCKISKYIKNDTYIKYVNHDYTFTYKNDKITIIYHNDKLNKDNTRYLYPFQDSNMLISFITNNRCDCMIEEIDSYLSPLEQIKIVRYLSEYISDKRCNLIVGTNSPYIITTFNNYIQMHNAYTALKNKKDKIDEYYKYINEKLMINFDDVSLYSIPTGKLYMDKEFRLIDGNSIDEASNVLDDEFEMLTNIEYS